MWLCFLFETDLWKMELLSNGMKDREREREEWEGVREEGGGGRGIR